MRKLRNTLLIIAGVICVVLGLLGILIPILPTTPFLLLAAYCFTRSSNRALEWLLNNRWFGSYIRNYREGRGMALHSKVITLFLLWLTIAFAAIVVLENSWVRLLLFLVAAGVTIHIIRIKTYRPDREKVAVQGEVEVK